MIDPGCSMHKIWFITAVNASENDPPGAAELCNRGATWLKNNTAPPFENIYPSPRPSESASSLAAALIWRRQKNSLRVYIKQRPVCFITSLRCSLIRMCGGRLAHSHHFVPAIISLAAILFRRRLNQLVAWCDAGLAACRRPTPSSRPYQINYQSRCLRRTRQLPWQRHADSAPDIGAALHKNYWRTAAPVVSARIETRTWDLLTGR